MFESSAPFYDLVPRDPAENLRWRIRCRERALTDSRFRDALWTACCDDPMFFMAFALWVTEPRARIKKRPFIPWSHQEPVVLAMEATIDKALDSEQPISLTLKKSRAQGGTFLYIAVTVRRALTQKRFTIGLVTRNESLVDSRVDDSAVLYKVAAMLDELPVWMLPDGYERNLTEHVIKLPNGSGWSGYAATGDVARGGRTTLFCFDEPGSEEFVAGNKDYKVMSSVGSVANCLFLVSTFGTDSGVFYESATDPDNPNVYTLDWKDNPEHSRLAYIQQGGVYNAVRPEEQKQVEEYIASHQRELKSIDRRGHKIEGKVRSPWYDSHCVAKGTLVVTDRGLVPIQDVMLGDRVWDGKMWVSHDGVLFQGWKETIRSYRVGLTPDHRVLTMKGWKHASDGFDRADVRLPDGYPQGQQQQVESSDVAVPMPVWNGKGDPCQRSEVGSVEQLRMPSKQPALQDSGVQLVGCDDTALHEPESSEVSVIRCSWNNGLPEVDGVCEIHRGYGPTAKEPDARSHRQRRQLRTKKLPLGNTQTAAEQPPKHYVRRDITGNDSHCGSGSQDRHDDQRSTRPHQERLDGGRSFASTQNPQPVYDLLNCGPRRAFTVIDDDGRPLLVHNCLLPGATPRYIARELDMDARGAAGKVFSADLLDRMKREHSKKPVWRGMPVFDSETLQLKGLIPRDDGPLILWFKPGLDDSPPLGPFTIACDIASGGVGAYSSNSVASGIDNRTGEQVLEYAIKGVEPRPFARTVVGLAMWMRKALLGWEDSGVSGGFAKEIMEVLYYGNVFFRDVTQLGSQKKSRKPGFPCRDADKADMFEQFALAMEQGKYIPRSEEMLRECSEYEWDGAKIIHAPTKNKGATEKNHGDRAISAAGAWLVFSNDNVADKVDSNEENGQTVEYGSFKWRELQERRGVDPGSPRYGIRDVIRRG